MNRTRRCLAVVAFAFACAIGLAGANPAPGTPSESAYGPHRLQRYDLYRPARIDRDTPTVLFVHGGGWAFGDKRHAIDAKRERWVAAGAIVVSTNYRLLPDADPLEQARDVARALASVQRRVAALGAHPSRIALMGHSAGAHLSALVAVSPTLQREAGVQPWAATVLLDSAALDVPAIMATSPSRLHRRAFGGDLAYWRAVSPRHRIEGPTAPVLAVCASAREHACPHNRSLLDALAARGTRTKLQPEALSHAEINRTLGEDNAYTRAVEAFLREAGLSL